MNLKSVAIGVLEDNIALRVNIEKYLIASNEFYTVFSVDSFENIEKIEYEPNIILLDIHLGEINALDLINSIRVRFRSAAIIIMTGDLNETYLLRAIENGASGYIYKPFSLIQLESTIRNVIENGKYLDSIVANNLLSALGQKFDVIKLKEKYHLTDREAEVLAMVKDGYSYKKISSVLKISYHTVNHHIKNSYAKLGIGSRGELIEKFSL